MTGNKLFELESITVTADKREEKIQEVPIAITVFTETDLEDIGIETISDLVDMIPNLTLDPMSTQPGSNAVSFRGIGPSMFTGKNPVVIYVDGIPSDNKTDYNIDLFDIERVEVLRGPQGTLYGKNAIGGVINVITKKPGDTYESKTFIEVAENKTYGVKGFINGPIIKDKLFLGLSVKYYETEGFMKNDHPDQDYFDSVEMRIAKTALKWLPSDQLEVNLHAGIALRENGAGTMISSGQIRYHENRDPDDKSDSDSFSSAMNVRYQNEFAEFTSITTYKDTELNYQTSISYLNAAYIYLANMSDSYVFTQEFRIQSRKKDNGLKWLGGIYYSDENLNFHDYSVVYDTEAFGYNMKYNWPYDLDEETTAIFGQITVPLVSSLKFTAGLRYEQINKKMRYRHYNTRTDTGEQLSAVEWNRDDDWNALLPRGILSWNMNKDSMFYASVAQGYLAGGMNFNSDDRETAKFDEQTSLNYEIGAKTAWLGNRLSLNAALFYIDIKDMHVYSNPEPGIYITSNAAKAHSQGIEIEAKAQPLQGMDIAASFGWIDSEFDDYGDYTGKTPTITPVYTLNLSAQYRHASGIFVRGEMEGYGKTYYNEANTTKRDPYQLYNAKIGYEASTWDVYLYVNNLLDKEYFSSLCYGAYIGKPRTIGMIASMRF